MTEPPVILRPPPASTPRCSNLEYASAQTRHSGAAEGTSGVADILLLAQRVEERSPSSDRGQNQLVALPSIVSCPSPSAISAGDSSKSSGHGSPKERKTLRVGESAFRSEELGSQEVEAHSRPLLSLSSVRPLLCPEGHSEKYTAEQGKENPSFLARDQEEKAQRTRKQYYERDGRKQYLGK